MQVAPIPDMMRQIAANEKGGSRDVKGNSAVGLVGFIRFVTRNEVGDRWMFSIRSLSSCTLKLATGLTNSVLAFTAN